jgi:hypothetical protein|nr:MAG TPA: internal head protein [Caudoviricetes sp.]
MERIYMDEFHYESYDNYKEALEAWSERAAHTQWELNAALDYDIGVEMNGLSDILLFDEKKLEEYIGTEGIKDKVKNMASRVKSNLTIWIKKFINFFFAWIVNFFKGVVNIRKSLKAGFDKAKAYVKKMNEMSGKLGSNDKDSEGENKTVKVTDASPLLIKCLSTVLISSYLLGKLGPLLNTVKSDVQNADKVDSESGQGKTIDKKTIEDIIDKLSAGVIALGGGVSACDPRDGDYFTVLKNAKFSIETIANDVKSLEPALNKKYKDERKSGFIAKQWKKITGKSNENPDDSEVKDYKETIGAIKNVLTENAKDMDDLEPEEMEYTKAFAIIKESLNAFINIAGANKSLWNFEKVAEGFEKVRRRLLPLIDKYNPEDDKESNELFNKIASIGNLMSSVSSNANKCMQNVNKYLDTVITDASRLGAAMTSATGKN